MATILTLFQTVMRKLTPAEVDANFTNLRTTADAAKAVTDQVSATPGANQIPKLTATGGLRIGALTDDGVSAVQAASLRIAGTDSRSPDQSTVVISMQNAYTSAFGSGSVLRFSGATDSAPNRWAAIASTYVNFDATNGEGGDLRFYTKNSSTDTAPIERVRITPSGALLVGTTTDDGSSKLQVNGNVKVGTTVRLSETAFAAFSDSLQHTITPSGGASVGKIKIVDGGGTSYIPYFLTGGAGVAYKWSFCTSAGWQINTNGSFTHTVSNGNTYSVTFDSAGVNLYIQRTAGTGNYTCTVLVG